MHFKAIIRVVKSIVFKDLNDYMGFDTVDVLREPLIEAVDKDEVKKILAEKYPQFFPNAKVYERESKNDKAQFFYVVIYPLFNHEIESVKSGNWVCDSCGQVHDNKYLTKPSVKYFGDKEYIFCPDLENRFNRGVCVDNFIKEFYKTNEIPDDKYYVNEDSPNYIYKITEKISNKCYIGKTRNAPFFRWWNHLKHSSSPFGIYLSETKLSDWTFEVLVELPSTIQDSEVFKIESEYIVKYDSINNGFNSLISNKNVINKEQQIDLFKEE